MRHQLTVDEVRSGVRFDDAVARTAWPVELHDRSDGYVWEMFPRITCNARPAAVDGPARRAQPRGRGAVHRR